MGMIARGSEPAFDEFYSRYHDKARSLILSMVKCDLTARECLNSAFFNVWRFAKDFTGGSQASTWFYRICWNEAAIHLRRKRNSLQNKIFENGVEPISSNLPPVTFDYEVSSYVRFVFKQLGQLPREYQETLRLSALDYSNVEIAKFTGQSLAASKSVKHRARADLRRLCGRG